MRSPPSNVRRLQLAVETHRWSPVSAFSPGQRQDMTFEIMASDYASQFAALLGGFHPRPLGSGS